MTLRLFSIFHTLLPLVFVLPAIRCAPEGDQEPLQFKLTLRLKYGSVKKPEMHDRKYDFWHNFPDKNQVITTGELRTIIFKELHASFHFPIPTPDSELTDYWRLFVVLLKSVPEERFCISDNKQKEGSDQHELVVKSPLKFFLSTIREVTGHVIVMKDVQLCKLEDETCITESIAPEGDALEELRESAIKAEVLHHIARKNGVKKEEERKLKEAVSKTLGCCFFRLDDGDIDPSGSYTQSWFEKVRIPSTALHLMRHNEKIYYTINLAQNNQSVTTEGQTENILVDSSLQETSSTANTDEVRNRKINALIAFAAANFSESDTSIAKKFMAQGQYQIGLSTACKILKDRRSEIAQLANALVEKNTPKKKENDQQGQTNQSATTAEASSTAYADLTLTGKEIMTNALIKLAAENFSQPNAWVAKTFIAQGNNIGHSTACTILRERKSEIAQLANTLVKENTSENKKKNDQQDPSN